MPFGRRRVGSHRDGGIDPGELPSVIVDDELCGDDKLRGGGPELRGNVVIRCDGVGVGHLVAAYAPARLCEWWGVEAEAVAEAGGLFRVVMDSGPIMRGEFLELARTTAR